MNFAKGIWPVLLLGLFCFAQSTTAENPEEDLAYFEVTDENLEEYSAQRLKFLAKLKRKAVIEWIRDNFRNNSLNYEELKPSFTEKYVVRYDVSIVGKDTPTPLIKMTGYLDGKGLGEWINKTRESGDSLSALLVLSSDFPNNQLFAQNTARSIKSSTFAKTMLNQLNVSLRKANLTASVVDLQGFPLSRPAQKKGKILRMSAFLQKFQFKTAIWCHISPCTRCGGGVMNLYFYNLGKSRLVATETRNLKMSEKDLSNAPTIAKITKPALDRFVSRVERAIRKGTLYSSVLRMVVQGLDSLGAYKRVALALEKTRFVSEAKPYRAEKGRAGFEILTKLDNRSFAERIENTNFGEFRLKLEQIDSMGLIMRYLELAGNKYPASVSESNSEE